VRMKTRHRVALAAGCIALLVAGALEGQPPKPNAAVIEIEPVGKVLPAQVPAALASALGFPTPPLGVVGIPPCRMVDTRSTLMPAGYGAPNLNAGAARSFVMTGQSHCSVPGTARGVVLNVTVVAPQAQGYLKLYPTGLPVPQMSTVNFRPDQVTGNSAITTLGEGGSLTVVPSVSLAVVIDVTGYLTSDLATQGPAGLNWQGPWTPKAYNANDAVSYKGSSYISVYNDNTSAPDTVEANRWQILAAKGDSSAWQPSDGGRLYTAGGIILGRDLWIGNDDQNSDPFWLARYNSGPNKSELRVNVGDDMQAEDKFAVGSYFSGDGLWRPRLVVQTDGKVGIGTDKPQEMLQVEGRVKTPSLVTGDVLFNKDGQPIWRLWADATGVFLQNLATGKISTLAAASP
jgi:hypothetical protein